MRINGAFVSLHHAKPTKPFGQTARPPLQAGEGSGLFRAAIPADIPDDAVVTKADIVLHVRESMGGSRQFRAQRNASGFKVSSATWRNAPTQTGTVRSVTVGAVPAKAEVRIPAAADVQQFVAGNLTNLGWLITTTDGTERRIYGATADNFQPYLDLEYFIPNEAPVNLRPDGAAVSIPKPVLTLTAPDDVVALRVIIDPAGDTLSPDWDSGEVPAIAGVLDLADTLFPGLAVDAVTLWLAQTKSSVGDWTDFSSAATLRRTAKTTVTVISPASTSGDKTPPVEWSAPGQVAWQVLLYDNITGKLLADSKKTKGTDTTWTPPKGLKRVGDVGRYEVRVWDAVDRASSAGDPDYAVGTRVFTLVTAGSAPGVTNLQAGRRGLNPAVVLTWSGAIADEWQIVRDDEHLERIDGSLREFYDYTSSAGVRHKWQVFPVSDGVVSPNSPTATRRHVPRGLWLVDPDTDEALLLVDETLDATAPEQVILHDVIDAPQVRRRIGKPPPRGTASGFIVKGDEGAAEAMAKIALRFKDNPQSTVYRLIYRDWNLPVTIGDILPVPIPLDDRDLAYSVSFLWWQTRDESLWES